MEKLKEGALNSTEKDYSEKFDSFRENVMSKSKSRSFKDVTEKLDEGIFTLAINSRKYIIPIYMLALFFTVVLISSIGSKSLKKRKKWIFFSLGISVIFLAVINIPLFILYTQSGEINNSETIEGIYNNMYDIVFFLNANSFTISALLGVYGVINSLLGKNDIPRKMVGSYLKKAALVLFIVMKALPKVIEFVIG
jgi:energy-coupling factor transporter transmembrane protein EcfT